MSDNKRNPNDRLVESPSSYWRSLQSSRVLENIGEGLIRIGAMTRDQVEGVLRRQRAGDKRFFGEIAVELGLIDDAAIQSYLNIRPGCKYQGNCHFRSIKDMNASNLLLKERYCDQWPEQCEIYRHKALGKPVSITLWPTGKLQV